MWFGFHCMNKVGEFVRILNKKHRRIVTDQIEDPFFGIELGGKTANIPHGIRRARRPAP